jgi:murein DD-endopeptidase MepM/ murein hydrolase activator NlpD
VRVLGAELAVAGRLHTALYFERAGHPGYFDAFGRGLDPMAWTGPLKVTRVNSAFGERRLHPILGRVLPHTGVDLAAGLGEPVHAAADGVIVSAGNRGGYGLLVEVLHASGYSTRYAHLSRLGSAIAPKRAIRRGDVLGYAGMSGLATGPHLHYEVRRQGQPIDPQGIIGDPALAADLAGDPQWPMERRRLSALLSRAPTVLRASRAETVAGL